MDENMINLGAFIADELRAMMIPTKQLYVSGNMKGSVQVVTVDENSVEIIIATDYASYTNTRGRMAGWIERTVDRACRCYAEKNNVDNESFVGNIMYGG